MSSIIIFLLAITIILWRPPFPLPLFLKKSARPAFIFALFFLLFLLLIADSNYHKFPDRNQQLSSEPNSTVAEKSFSF